MTTSDQNQPDRRKPTRLTGYDYTRAGGYFVTMVSFERRPIFGEIIAGTMRLNEIGKIVSEEWEKTQNVRDNILLDEFVIMPNHLHGIIFILDDDVGATQQATHRVAPTGSKSTIVSGSLGAIIGQIKSISTKRINQYRGIAGSPIWQRNYYEHIIRDERDLLAIREYIRNNPLQWDLDHENPLSKA